MMLQCLVQSFVVTGNAVFPFFSKISGSVIVQIHFSTWATSVSEHIIIQMHSEYYKDDSSAAYYLYKVIRLLMFLWLLLSVKKILMRKYHTADSYFLYLRVWNAEEVKIVHTNTVLYGDKNASVCLFTNVKLATSTGSFVTRQDAVYAIYTPRNKLHASQCALCWPIRSRIQKP